MKVPSRDLVEIWVDDDFTSYRNYGVEELFEFARQEIIANPDARVEIRFSIEIDMGFGHIEKFDAGFMDLYTEGIPCPNV